MNRRPRLFSAHILNAGLIVGACAIATASFADARRPLPVAVVALPRLVSVTRSKEVFRDHEELVFNGMRNTAGTCAAITVDIDGVEETRTNVTFPLTLSLFRRDRLYPRTDGVHTLTLKGHRGSCRGVVQTTFHTRTTPRVPRLAVTGPAVANGHGTVTAFQVSGFDSPTAKGALTIRGNGVCRMHADIMDLGQPSPAVNPPVRKIFDPGAQLPVEIDDLGPFPNGSYRAYLIGYDDAKCPVQGPDKNAGGWYVDFKIGNGVSAPNNAQNPPPNNGGGSPPGGGGGGNIPSGNKPATGQITSMLVPDGSFAEDDPQKLQVNGTGGCAMSLQISDKSYGGSYDQTYPVNPLKLDPGATLYNGENFGTLAEASYHAQVTGTGGCTGTAGIDFKVTPKVSTKKVMGKPTIGFDQQPKSGSTFSASKDSNIWFKVTVPQSIKDEPYASCCDIEYDYKNEYGGWEPLPNSPFNDSSFGLAITQPAGVAPRSVSYFSNGTQWRMKVRGYKFQTEFEWSDWVEFQVDQH